MNIPVQMKRITLSGQLFCSSKNGVGANSKKGNRLAEYGETSVYLFTNGGLYARVRQGTVTRSLGPLQDASHYTNMITWLSPSEFLIVTGDMPDQQLPVEGEPISVLHYRITDNAIELVGSTIFGDTLSKPLDMIRLASGATLLAWYEWVKGQTVEVNFAYTPDGVDWSLKQSSIFNVNILPRTNGTLCQHPVDGSIWLFTATDSDYNIVATHLTETDGNISVDWVDNDFTRNAGVLCRDPEFPCMTAIQTADTILLAYQNFPDHTFWFWDGAKWGLDYIAAAPYCITSKVTLVDISADGTKKLRAVVDRYIGRVSPFGLGFQSNGRLWFSGYWFDPSLPPSPWRMKAWLLPEYTEIEIPTPDEAQIYNGPKFVFSTNRLVYDGINGICERRF